MINTIKRFASIKKTYIHRGVLLIMIMPHTGNILDFFPEASDITTSKLWCQCLCTLSFVIPQYLILSIFEPCSGLFHEFMNNSWARLAITTPKKMCLARFFVWFCKVIILSKPRRNMTFLWLYNISLVSFWQAVHNAPIHFTEAVDIALVITANTREINNIIWQLYFTQQTVYSLPVVR